MVTFYEMEGFGQWPKYASIIGEAPSKNSDWRYPLAGGHTGKKIEKLLGLSFRDYLKYYRRFDLIKFYPGTRWPKENASGNARIIRDLHEPGAHLVLLGRKVAEAFGAGDLEFCEYDVRDGVTYWVSPHPSGLNRWWQDPKNHDRGLDFWEWISQARPTPQNHSRNVQKLLCWLRTQGMVPTPCFHKPEET